ncbi:MAG: DUF4384 domain-containing protein [Acidobacteriota bacterium]|nr:DUF4384 domain-containing protein [Acidobacteriota bacterium]
MKKFIATLFIAVAFLTTNAFAQSEDDARDLFRTHVANANKGRPGVKIRIELLRNGQRQFVPLNTEFSSGDKVKLHFEANFPAYVEIYNQGSSGNVQRLFPYETATSPVKVVSGYVVPRKATEWFEFDATPGTEKLAFIFSRAQIVAKPPVQTVAKKKPGLVVNPGQSEADKTQLAQNDLNKSALEQGRDLNRVQVKDEHYVFGNPEKLKQAVGVLITLQHR